MALAVLLPLLGLLGFHQFWASSSVVEEKALSGIVVRMIVGQTEAGSRATDVFVRLPDGAEVVATQTQNQVLPAGTSVRVIERRYSTGRIRFFIE